MAGSRWRGILVALALGAVMPTSDASVGAAPARYVVDAALAPAERTIAGTLAITLRNPAALPLDELVLVLYPNRFAVEDPRVNDVNRPFVYPREDFVPGGMTIEAIEPVPATTAGLVSEGPGDMLEGRDLHRADPSVEGHGPADAVPDLPDARDGGGEPADGRREAIASWPDTLLRVRLPSAIAPGGEVTLRVRFRTVLPERYGPFGVADGRVAALAGWFPMLPALDGDGRWRPDVPASAAAVSGRLRVPTAQAVVLGASFRSADAGDGGTIAFTLPADAPPTLLASPDYERAERAVEDATLVLAALPSRRAFALPRLPRHVDVVLEAAERIVRERPAGLSLSGGPLLIAEAPLRQELGVAAGPGVAVVSDRLLRVHRLLREFHERALAAAVYGAMLWRDVAARETPGDAPWVREGLAAELADRWLAAAHPRHRTVYDWIGLFDVFAIVDRFESAPKIPFERAFFPEARHADELRETFEGFARDRPAGRTVFTKLRNRLGPDAYQALVARYLAGDEPLRALASAVAGHPLDAFIDEWTAPYPALDYGLERAELNRGTEASDTGGSPADDGSAPGASAAAGGTPDDAAGPRARAAAEGTPEGAADAETSDATRAAPPAYRHVLVARRAASRPVDEPVEIELRGRHAERARLVWDDARARASFVVTTPWQARRAVLDPDRKLLEDTRVDNTRPPLHQIVLDSADVTITSSEFGISGLFVARRRYDYTKDLGLVGFFSDRAVGFHFGPRLHLGTPNDATSYRHNLYAFFTFETLRGDFRDDSRPGRGTDGVLGGVGMRYDYGDEVAFDNPVTSTKLRLFADCFTGALGSSFDYVDWGVRASVVRPLLGPRTLVALQAMNAFSTPFDGSRVPNQGRYSLGGDLAIRGIRVDERLAENVVLARAELRQTIYPEVDLNLGDWVVVRHGQLRLFVDAGRVEDRRGSLYRVGDFAVGVGIGAAAAYEFMGFYPAVAYVAIAQRVDRFAGVDNGVQFLFGTRQAF